jgi:hypothetical protein
MRSLITSVAKFREKYILRSRYCQDLGFLKLNHSFISQKLKIEIIIIIKMIKSHVERRIYSFTVKTNENSK